MLNWKQTAVGSKVKQTAFWPVPCNPPRLLEWGRLCCLECSLATCRHLLCCLPSFTSALKRSAPDSASSLSSVSRSETVDGARDLEKNDIQSRVPYSWGQDSVLQVEKRRGSLGLRSGQGFFLASLWSYIKVDMRRKDSGLSRRKFIESQAWFPQAIWLLYWPCPGFSFVTDRESSFCYVTPTAVARNPP